MTVWLPLLDVDRLRVKPLEPVKAKRPTVALVAASETVQELLVTDGTVYEPTRLLFEV